MEITEVWQFWTLFGVLVLGLFVLFCWAMGDWDGNYFHWY